MDEARGVTVASTSGIDDEVALLQLRLDRLYSVMVVIMAIAVPAHFAVAPPTYPLIIDLFVVGLAAGSVLLRQLVRSRRRRTLGQLRVIEAGSLLGFTSMYATIILIGTGRIEDIDFSVTCVGFLVFGRSLLVPSSWRRTLWLSLACMLMPFGALIDVAIEARALTALSPANFIVNGLFVCGIPVVLATVGSRVISRLRNQVRDARQLGQYTLGDKIGEGGMGTVYKARHALLRRPTAIKLLRADRLGEEAIRRFEHEVQITAGLTDPHIVAIFDYGRSADGTFYYAMEYLDGIDLERLVRDFGPQPPGRVVAILRQVCDALAEAHAGGLIHRDIKPANILLCERGLCTDAVKVVDFGLVQHVDANTDDAGISGTPGYLSPEAISDPASVGAASDLYALGAVAYYLLTGTTVFAATTFVEICDQHLHATPEAPSSRIGRPIPMALDALVLASLAKAPVDRPPSALAMRDRLDALDVQPWPDAELWWRAFRARPATPVDATIDPVAQTVAVAARG